MQHSVWDWGTLGQWIKVLETLVFISIIFYITWNEYHASPLQWVICYAPATWRLHLTHGILNDTNLNKPQHLLHCWKFNYAAGSIPIKAVIILHKLLDCHGIPSGTILDMLTNSKAGVPFKTWWALVVPWLLALPRCHCRCGQSWHVTWTQPPPAPSCPTKMTTWHTSPWSHSWKQENEGSSPRAYPRAQGYLRISTRWKANSSMWPKLIRVRLSIMITCYFIVIVHLWAMLVAVHNSQRKLARAQKQRKIHSKAKGTSRLKNQDL